MGGITGRARRALNFGRMSAGLQQRSLPVHRFLDEAAGAIVEAHRAALPDLSGLTVLLPSLHAAPAMACALAQAAGTPVLLLPRLATLPDWAAGVPIEGRVVADSEREAQVYAALAERNWFPEADRWHVAAELRELADELTLHLVALPQSGQDLVSRLEDAYRAKAGEPMQFEARLVHEAWHVLAPAGGAADKAGRYLIQLARRADAPPGPLVIAGVYTFTPAERTFIEGYAKSAPVLVLETVPGTDALAGALAAAWPMRSSAGDEPAADLLGRSLAFRDRTPRSPLAGRVTLCGATSLEQEAHAADVKIRSWLLAGKATIAVVAQDRLVARRLRALLERASVLVEDETGWTLSTVAATTVLMRLLDCVSGDFYHRDFLDLLKSPLVFADLEPEARKADVFALEQLVRRHGIVAGLGACRAEAQREREAVGATALAMLDRLDTAARALKKGPAPLATWLERLRESLDALAVTPALEKDSAGQQLLSLLERLARELAGEGTRIPLGEWRRWLDRQLEAETFRDREVESPVVFTHLAATRLRAFDGVVLLGFDAAHFPPRPQAGLFFNQAVRGALGLPTREQALEETRRDLAALVAAAGETFVTWQRSVRGEHNALAPPFELLEAFHRLAYGFSLIDGAWLACLPAASVVAATDAPAAATVAGPAPAVPTALVPRSVSVSGYGSLVACPYQFFARHVLRLNELDEVSEDIEKRDYGEVVHRILLEFHRRHPAVTGEDPMALASDLERSSERVFGSLAKENYLAHAWFYRWKKAIAGYLAWQLEREQAGWRFDGGEQKAATSFEADGVAIELRGRLDRLDRRGDELSVIDYKTQDASALRRRLEQPGEDVQLSAYALLRPEVGEAAFLAVDEKNGKPRPVAPGEALPALAGRERVRFVDVFGRILAGAPLPANGEDSVCGWCEMQSLCRKRYWTAP